MAWNAGPPEIREHRATAQLFAALVDRLPSIREALRRRDSWEGAGWNAHGGGTNRVTMCTRPTRKGRAL